MEGKCRYYLTTCLGPGKVRGSMCNNDCPGPKRKAKTKDKPKTKFKLDPMVSPRTKRKRAREEAMKNQAPPEPPEPVAKCPEIIITCHDRNAVDSILKLVQSNSCKCHVRLANS